MGFLRIALELIMTFMWLILGLDTLWDLLPNIRLPSFKSQSNATTRSKSIKKGPEVAIRLATIDREAAGPGLLPAPLTYDI